MTQPDSKEFNQWRNGYLTSFKEQTIKTADDYHHATYDFYEVVRYFGFITAWHEVIEFDTRTVTKNLVEAQSKYAGLRRKGLSGHLWEAIDSDLLDFKHAFLHGNRPLEYLAAGCTPKFGVSYIGTSLGTDDAHSVVCT